MEHKKKYYKNFNCTIELYKFFVNEEKPEFIIGFIYNNIYELINEMKYIPHNEPFFEFHETLGYVYKEYYEKILVTSNDPFLLHMFPNPNYKYKFNFKKFYIGVAGRFKLNISHWYGDPATWNLSYFIELEERKVSMSICQYIFLENNSLFQMKEEVSQELTDRISPEIVVKNLYKYPGQRVILLEEKYLYCARSYDKLKEEEIKTRISLLKEWFNKEYNPRIYEACEKLYREEVKPLYFCEAELFEELLSYIDSKDNSSASK